jgi:hypothetical protein
MHLSEEQLSLAWLTANRRVDNDTELYAWSGMVVGRASSPSRG